jgi:hypothetical protein
MKHLFEKKRWTLTYSSPSTSNGTIECRGNFFGMVYAVFRILTRKRYF